MSDIEARVAALELGQEGQGLDINSLDTRLSALERAPAAARKQYTVRGRIDHTGMWYVDRNACAIASCWSLEEAEKVRDALNAYAAQEAGRG